MGQVSARSSCSCRCMFDFCKNNRLVMFSLLICLYLNYKCLFCKSEHYKLQKHMSEFHFTGASVFTVAQVRVVLQTQNLCTWQEWQGGIIRSFLALINVNDDYLCGNVTLIVDIISFIKLASGLLYLHIFYRKNILCFCTHQILFVLFCTFYSSYLFHWILEEGFLLHLSQLFMMSLNDCKDFSKNQYKAT